MQHFDFSSADERASLVTYYGHCRFRSLIEARWAVVFDFLSISWRYEPRTFYSHQHFMAYRPDFLLPRLGYWCEIKGQPPTERELLKVDILRDAVLRKGDKVFVLVGPLPDGMKDFPEGFDLHRGEEVVQQALDRARGWRFNGHRRAPKLSDLGSGRPGREEAST